MPPEFIQIVRNSIKINFKYSLMNLLFQKLAYLSNSYILAPFRRIISFRKSPGIKATYKLIRLNQKNAASMPEITSYCATEPFQCL